MTQQFYSRYSQQGKTMTEQQFEEIVSAILAGKYSWACVLILQTAGYNPLHYIPYRTYNRLIKENRLCSSQKSSKEPTDNQVNPKPCSLSQSTQKTLIKNLSYLETAEGSSTKLKGGIRHQGDFNYLFLLA